MRSTSCCIAVLLALTAASPAAAARPVKAAAPLEPPSVSREGNAGLVVTLTAGPNGAPSGFTLAWTTDPLMGWCEIKLNGKGPGAALWSLPSNTPSIPIDLTTLDPAAFPGVSQPTPAQQKLPAAALCTMPCAAHTYHIRAQASADHKTMAKKSSWSPVLVLPNVGGLVLRGLAITPPVLYTDVDTHMYVEANYPSGATVRVVEVGSGGVPLGSAPVLLEPTAFVEVEPQNEQVHYSASVPTWFDSAGTRFYATVSDDRSACVRVGSLTVMSPPTIQNTELVVEYSPGSPSVLNTLTEVEEANAGKCGKAGFMQWVGDEANELQAVTADLASSPMTTDTVGDLTTVAMYANCLSEGACSEAVTITLYLRDKTTKLPYRQHSLHVMPGSPADQADGGCSQHKVATVSITIVKGPDTEFVDFAPETSARQQQRSARQQSSAAIAGAGAAVTVSSADV